MPRIDMVGYNWQSNILPFLGIIRYLYLYNMYSIYNYIYICIMSLSYANIHIYNPVQGLPAHSPIGWVIIAFFSILSWLTLGVVGMGDLKR